MEPHPRSNGSRVARMTVLIAATATVTSAIETFFSVDFYVAGHAFPGHGGWWSLLSLTVFAFYGYLATRVSLPWYYVGWFLVPIAGIFALWKISWRAAYLPWRDWDLREGEVRGPYDVGHDLYGTRERMVHVRPE